MTKFVNKKQLSVALKGVTFRSKDERESKEISGVCCAKALISNADSNDNALIYSQDRLVAVCSLSSDNILTLFTTTAKRTTSYGREVFKLCNMYSRKRKYIVVNSSAWYKETTKFLVALGFYRARAYGGVYKWVLERKQ